MRHQWLKWRLKGILSKGTGLLWEMRNKTIKFALTEHKGRRQIHVSREQWLQLLRRDNRITRLQNFWSWKIPIQPARLLSFMGNNRIWSEYWEDFLGIFLGFLAETPSPKQLSMFLSSNQNKLLTISPKGYLRDKIKRKVKMIHLKEL